MKLKPRTTHALALASLLALAPPCADALHTGAAPQQPATATATQQPTSNKREAKTREQRKTKTRERRDEKPSRQSDAQSRARREREQAVAVLVEAAEAVRPADDLYESVRLRAEVADVLWPHDAAAARAMLRRAWEAANAPGAEDGIDGFEDQPNPRELARLALDDLRRAVVKVAHKHDPALAEELMRRFERGLTGDADATREGEGVEEASSSSNTDGPRALSRGGWRRLHLALDLLGDDEHARAAATAAPLVAEGPTVPLLDFIDVLRIEAPREADALYLRLLEHTRAAATANANDVLLLSTPVVSPTLRVEVGAGGSVRFAVPPLYGLSTSGDFASRRAPATLPAAVRRAFFDTAAAVLLRPRAGVAQRTDEATRLYFAAARLLPFFEREAPQHAAALHALVATLAADFEASRRDALTSQAGVSNLTPKNPPDPLASMLKEVTDAPDARARDAARFNVVTVAAHRRLWDRARLVAAEIEDEETRRNARRVIAMEQVMDTLRAYGDDAEGRKKDADKSRDPDDDDDDAERAAEFVRAADVPPEVRAAGLAQAAELAARRGAAPRVDELLVEAASHAEQSEREDFHRAHAFAFVTLAAARTGSARTWDSLAALVRALNEHDDYTLALLSFHYTFEHLGGSSELWVTRSAHDSSDLSRVFAAAARLDFARALAETRAFKDGVVRGHMLLAVARAALPRKERRDAKTAP